MLTRHRLSGRVVAVTGGARGIGEATATALAAAGATVVIGDLDLDLAKQSAETYDGLALPLDVASGPPSPSSSMAWCVSTVGSTPW